MDIKTVQFSVRFSIKQSRLIYIIYNPCSARKNYRSLELMFSWAFLYQAVVANMISIFRKMSPGHYDQYIHNFNVNDPAGRCDLVTILLLKKFLRL